LGCAAGHAEAPLTRNQKAATISMPILIPVALGVVVPLLRELSLNQRVEGSSPSQRITL
jgi:hypothetical protein